MRFGQRWWSCAAPAVLFLLFAGTGPSPGQADNTFGAGVVAEPEAADPAQVTVPNPQPAAPPGVGST